MTRLRSLRSGIFLTSSAAAILGIALLWTAIPALSQGKAASQTPRTADGHPDFTGLWNGAVNPVFIKSDDPLTSNLASRDGSLLNFERDFTLVRRADQNKPLYKPQFWEKIQQLDQNGNKEDPSYGCMPGGVPRMGPPAKIIQTAKEFVFLYVSPPAQGWGDQYRDIPADGRKHTPLQDLDGTWKGESIAHWEGDTLVIDTIGFNDTSWLEINGYFHSENMHVIERMHRDGNMLTWQATVEDPDVLIKPWTMNPRTVILNPDPQAELAESLPCVEHDLSHLVGKDHH
ncbi:MAG TPA: hypothetical protein VGR73_12985 [Bryobacteraceae bacterium]|nr:hypothetical protein [Bryobacteraceae bacterium]